MPCRGWVAGGGTAEEKRQNDTNGSGYDVHKC